MSRTITQIQCEMQQDQFNQILNTYMTSEGFKLCLVKGEQVWKKGNGFITAPQFLKVDYLGNSILLQAWVKYAWLPFVYSGEKDLNGAYGFAIKEMLRARMNNLIKQFNNASGVNYQQFLNNQSRYCDNCGVALPHNAQFCPSCGKQFANV